MKNFKIILQIKEVLPSDDFQRIVKTVTAKSKAAALKDIARFENFERFNVVSCEVRK